MSSFQLSVISPQFSVASEPGPGDPGHPLPHFRVNWHCMILPFVRDLLADLEHTASFEQAQRHLSLGRGRRRVSGLTSTARSLYISLLARAAKVPVVLLVADNKAADAMHLALRAGCELTGAIAPEQVLKLPAHDVLPFENLSPHPEVQE